MPHADAVLVVEDDPALADLLALHLRDLGFRVDVAADGADGLARALVGDYALVVLDRMLPRREGLDVCRALRRQGVATPVLMLTAKSEDDDKVDGLDAGADDYVTKPFSVRELMARVNALLRRRRLDATASEATDEVRVGPLRLSLPKRQAAVEGRALELTAMEFDLLALFARNPGRAFSRQELLDLVWGYHYAGYSHTVNSHINRLRAKLEPEPERPRFIRTVWGVGYRFAEPHEFDADGRADEHADGHADAAG